jgi:hypothetical protein
MRARTLPALAAGEGLVVNLSEALRQLEINVGKRVQFDEETWQAIQAVTRQTGKSFQELARTAFAEMLKKHN